MGLLSRNKGKSFEREIGQRFRTALTPCLPTLTVRRSSQAERAYEADLIIEGPDVPAFITTLWVECQHAKRAHIDPPGKHRQAVRDSAEFAARTRVVRTPVVCWRANGERTVWLTATMGDLASLLALPRPDVGADILATVALDAALGALASRSLPLGAPRGGAF